jgi:hypothetical protein
VLKHFNWVGASSPPDPWFTREVLYIAPYGFDPLVERQNTTRWQNTTHCTQSFLSHGLRAQDRGRVGASGTFVGVGVHLLGWRPAITFLGSVFDTTSRYCSIVFLYYLWLERCADGGSEDRHCILYALHRMGRLHRQALCRLAPASMPLGIIYFDCLLFYILSTYSHTMLDQILSWIFPLICFYF